MLQAPYQRCRMVLRSVVLAVAERRRCVTAITNPLGRFIPYTDYSCRTGTCIRRSDLHLGHCFFYRSWS
jgi:hypothetical protein